MRCRGGAPVASGLVGLEEAGRRLRYAPPLPVDLGPVVDDQTERGHAGFPPGLRLLRRRAGTAARALVKTSW